MKVSTQVEARFWAKVDRSQGPDSCWNWLGYKHPDGHGQLKITAISKRPLYAHRLAWELANNQSIPDGKIIRHDCDNPACCNPAHHRLGTQFENMRDCMSRNRRATKAKGTWRGGRSVAS